MSIEVPRTPEETSETSGGSSGVLMEHRGYDDRSAWPDLAVFGPTFDEVRQRSTPRRPQDQPLRASVAEQEPVDPVQAAAETAETSTDEVVGTLAALGASLDALLGSMHEIFDADARSAEPVQPPPIPASEPEEADVEAPGDDLGGLGWSLDEALRALPATRPGPDEDAEPVPEQSATAFEVPTMLPTPATIDVLRRLWDPRVAPGPTSEPPRRRVDPRPTGWFDHRRRRAALTLAALAAVAAVLVFGYGYGPRNESTPGTSGAPAAGQAPLAGAASPVSMVPPGGALAAFVAQPEVSVVAQAVVPTVDVFSGPASGNTTFELDNPTANGGPLVFYVVGVHGDWLHVDLPVRPNGTQGWIRRSDVSTYTHTYRIVVSRGQHELKLYRAGNVVMETPVAIGSGDTPTPGGVFYIKELLQPPDPAGIYGPYAFGLSGFSNTLTEFAGGEGVIGIHGTNDPSSIGKDVSHGCIRLPNDELRKLVGLLPLGTPVAITQ